MQNSVEKLTMEHWESFIPEITNIEVYNIINSDKNLLYNLFNNDNTYAICKGSDILAIVGGEYTIYNTMEISILIGISFKKYLLSSMKLIKKLLVDKVPKHITRLESHIDKVNSKAFRLAYKLGFSVIGIRHKLGKSKTDCILMEKLIEE